MFTSFWICIWNLGIAISWESLLPWTEFRLSKVFTFENGKPWIVWPCTGFVSRKETRFGLENFTECEFTNFDLFGSGCTDENLTVPWRVTPGELPLSNLLRWGSDGSGLFSDLWCGVRSFLSILFFRIAEFESWHILNYCAESTSARNPSPPRGNVWDLSTFFYIEFGALIPLPIEPLRTGTPPLILSSCPEFSSIPTSKIFSGSLPDSSLFPNSQPAWTFP